LCGSDEKLKELAQKNLDIFLRRYPSVATDLGIHDYDDKLDDPSPEWYAESVRIAKDMLRELEEINDSEHSKLGLIDREIFKASLEDYLFRWEVIALHEKNPDFGLVVAGGIFSLFMRNFAPVEERMRCIASRLEQVPRAFEGFKRSVTRPIQLWTELAIQSLQGIPGFIQLIVSVATEQINEKELERLKKAAETATGTIEEAKKWLEELKPKASEDWVIGLENFEKLLDVRRIKQTPDEILKIGVQYLAQFKQQLKELSQQIAPGKSIEEVREKLKDDHPKTFDEVLQTYRDWVARARQWVIDNDFATVLDGELNIIETPDFLRPLVPIAGMFAPSIFDEKKVSEYIVTRPDDEKNLREHFLAVIPNTCIHEAYPGHFLQLLGMGSVPASRILLFELTLIEGWAFYCEQATKDLGFNNTPDAFFAQTLGLIWRAVRIIIDVKLSTGQMTFDEAVKMLMDETGMEEPSAVAEVSRYTMSPSYQLSYLLGRHLIMEVRQELENEFGKEFNLKLFHDTIITAGSIPVSFIPELYRIAVR
jgi:uncharacterized protein (DUF885 family)